MALSTGTRIGPYEIRSPIGEGGMGVVYGARDTILQRDVALKLLPDHFATDADRLSRFQREAQVLASLNHPNIAQIYGVDTTGASRCIVMELIEGETLQQRLARGPIPSDEALEIAKQIAEALEAAHEKGITHRDLKPANIKWTPDGRVKVLDFGLAKVQEASNPATQLSNSPTMMSGSVPGMILGTAAYMSPEQAKGKQADHKADVWAFGCVLFEMLSGRSVFEGETTSEILAGVLKGEPDWQRLPPETSETIRRLIRRCLQKDRKKRLQDIGDARIEIEEFESAPSLDRPAAQNPSRRKERLAWAGALVVMTLIAGIAGIRAIRPEVSAPEMRVDIVTPPLTDTLALASIAISPDGQQIVFRADTGGPRLWLRSIGSTVARPLQGTENGAVPFWSPDGRSIGFFADRQLKRIDVDGGLVKTLAMAPTASGGTWNRDGLILFGPSYNGRPIYRIPATGGEPVAVTQVDPARQPTHRSPIFLPDGRHFLYYVPGDPGGVYLGQVDGSETRRLLDADLPGVYEFSGHILFMRQGTLFAQKLDPDRLLLSGDPFPVTEQLAGNSDVAVSTSAAGPIIYRSSGGLERQFSWFDRTGKRLETVGNPDKFADVDPSISADGRVIATSRTINGNTDVWLLDVVRGLLRRFTVDVGMDQRPLFSPDGTQIIFSRLGIHQKSVSGSGTEELLVERRGGTDTPLDWSSDGRLILYRHTETQTGLDIWVFPVAGDRKPFPVVQTKFGDDNGQFSSDGKWVAYQSNESGRFEIYVQRFPDGGGKTQISIDGAVQPRWRRDTKELFYVGLDNRLMAVPIGVEANGQTIQPGAPISLFETQLVQTQQSRQAYIVSPDGQRFLMNTPTNDSASTITLILNWKPKS